MTTAVATHEETTQLADTAAIRPFKAKVPETELTELRRRINDTSGLNEKRSQMQRKAYNSRRLRRSRAIGARNTIGASARQN